MRIWKLMLMCGTMAMGGLAAARPAAVPAHMQSKVFHQLRYHQQLPADRQQLLAGFAATLELDGAESAWLAHQLPAGTYSDRGQVLRALFPQAPERVVAALDRPVLAQR